MHELPASGLPKVSLITGTYNSMPYLANLIKCYQAQTFTDWEAIFVDDGSKDGTPGALEEYARQDPRIRVLRKLPEGYPSRSRNVGLQAARGEFVAFCDHDDFWTPDKLATQLAAFAEHPETAILHTDRRLWYHSTLPDPMPRLAFERNLVRKESAWHSLYTGQKIIFSSFMAKRSLLEKVGGLHPDLRGVDDFHLFLKLAQHGPIYKIQQPLTYYYEHAQNLSRTPDIFVKGLMAVAEVLRDEGQYPRLVPIVLAQANKSLAVSLLISEPKRALALLAKSLRLYVLPRSLFLLPLSLVLSALPKGVREGIVGKLLKIKAQNPTLGDLLPR